MVASPLFSKFSSRKAGWKSPYEQTPISSRQPSQPGQPGSYEEALYWELKFADSLNCKRVGKQLFSRDFRLSLAKRPEKPLVKTRPFWIVNAKTWLVGLILYSQKNFQLAAIYAEGLFWTEFFVTVKHLQVFCRSCFQYRKLEIFVSLEVSVVYATFCQVVW